jgi:hypothetical protein
MDDAWHGTKLLRPFLGRLIDDGTSSRATEPRRRKSFLCRSRSVLHLRCTSGAPPGTTARAWDFARFALALVLLDEDRHDEDAFDRIVRARRLHRDGQRQT